MSARGSPATVGYGRDTAQGAVIFQVMSVSVGLKVYTGNSSMLFSLPHAIATLTRNRTFDPSHVHVSRVDVCDAIACLRDVTLPIYPYCAIF